MRAGKLMRRAQAYVGRYRVVLSEGASFELDGSQRELEPGGMLYLPLGKHTLVASAQGCDSATRKLGVRGGEDATLEMGPCSIEATAVAPAPQQAAPAPEETAAAGPVGYVPDEPAAQSQPGPAGATAGGGEDDDGVVGQWWFWTGIGVVAVASVATVLLVGTDPDPEPLEEANFGPAVAALEFK